ARANKPILAARLAPDANVADAMQGARVVAFAGIARPEKFFNLLEACGAEVAARVSFADHCRFTQRDYTTLSKLRQEHGARPVTTEKDAARMGGQLATLGVDTLPVTLVFEDAVILDAALRGLRKILNRAS
ncbi:tetraacyldisaccharide 4'-kinase, partial [Methylocystis suflitae]|uniref:tetraacyldisaccharide 4'-kinase n=1 Tax=Methylocystis suflitae TaxID=2951405 RepID=UPI002108A06B